MNKIEQTKFVRDLVATVSKSMLEKIERVPDEWDGHELRQWIADEFARETTRVPKGRLKHYRNDVLVHNL